MAAPASDQISAPEPRSLEPNPDSLVEILGRDEVGRIIDAQCLSVRKTLESFRKIVADRDKPISLTRGRYEAIILALSKVSSDATLQIKAAGKKRVELEQRIAALEDKALKALAYHGVWSAETEYEAGSCVTDKGGLWITSIKSKGLRPGDGNGAWRLAVKSGAAR